DSKFQNSVQKKAEIIANYLNKLIKNYPNAGLSRRGRGMMQGLVCSDPKLADKITELAFKNGLVIETSGGQDEVIKLLMPLTIEQETLLAGLDILEHAVSDAVAELGSSIVTKEKETV